MGDGAVVREVRGAEARCYGPEDAPHPGLRLPIPPDEEAVCPLCGLRYRRSPWWNRLTEAIWPRPR